MLILIGAVVVGVIAALLIFQYVGSVEQKAQGAVRTEKMLVAIAPIPKGAVGTGSVDLVERRSADRPADAVGRPEDIKSQIAAIDIAPGTVITSSMFVNPTDLKDSNSEVLEKGMTAVTLSFDAVHGVAGLVKPGDFVNIMTNTAVCENQQVIRDEAKNPKGLGLPCTGYVYQKAKVLAIGQSFGEATAAAPSADGSPTTTAAPVMSDQVTFSVPAEAATLLAYFSPGSLYLTLVRDDYVPHPIPLITDFAQAPGVAGSTPEESAPANDPNKAPADNTNPSGK